MLLEFSIAAPFSTWSADGFRDLADHGQPWAMRPKAASPGASWACFAELDLKRNPTALSRRLFPPELVRLRFPDSILLKLPNSPVGQGDLQRHWSGLTDGAVEAGCLASQTWMVLIPRGFGAFIYVEQIEADASLLAHLRQDFGELAYDRLCDICDSSLIKFYENRALQEVITAAGLPELPCLAAMSEPPSCSWGYSVNLLAIFRDVLELGTGRERIDAIGQQLCGAASGAGGAALSQDSWFRSGPTGSVGCIAATAEPWFGSGRVTALWTLGTIYSRVVLDIYLRSYDLDLSEFTQKRKSDLQAMIDRLERRTFHIRRFIQWFDSDSVCTRSFDAHIYDGLLAADEAGPRAERLLAIGDHYVSSARQLVDELRNRYERRIGLLLYLIAALGILQLSDIFEKIVGTQLALAVSLGLLVALVLALWAAERRP